MSISSLPCLLCGAMSRHGAWCADCDNSLPYLSAAHCPVCALPSPHGATCGQCLRKQPLFDRTSAIYAYAFPMDKLIQSFKFNQQLQLAGSLADKLAADQHAARLCFPCHCIRRA